MKLLDLIRLIEHIVNISERFVLKTGILLLNKFDLNLNNARALPYDGLVPQRPFPQANGLNKPLAKMVRRSLVLGSRCIN